MLYVSSTLVFITSLFIVRVHGVIVPIIYCLVFFSFQNMQLDCIRWHHSAWKDRRTCKFHRSEIEFMGHLLSARGIGPTQAKVEAVTEARKPESVAEVCSFLGLVYFCARFIPNQSINQSINQRLYLTSNLLTAKLQIQSTPDNSNLQGKSKKKSSYREFELSGARRK